MLLCFGQEISLKSFTTKMKLKVVHTRRWPLAVFYGLISASGMNAFIIISFCTAAIGNKSPTRLAYLHDLGLQLVTPFMHQWLMARRLQTSIQSNIEAVLKSFNSLPEVQQSPNQ
ncbi:hypothetical protein PR048_031633 [Dryococelus australis]|uniref:Uncharacterized protein n=1 Tax=Dryococelus australis TaxID=614101 RepID=A0ABQ9G6H3_9NEOP|nr:hypothetical protein PR048_031633 [Dryococelus australis]